MSPLRLCVVGAAIIVVWLGLFLWVFTGDCTATKNRVAIAFSYVQVLLALIVPFLLVDFFASNPTVLAFMREAPIGICLANVNNHPQWVLNIGSRVPSEPVVGLTENGLIIPLYVIVLAFVGGAINLTRQVPRFQPESERRETQQPLLPYGERRKIRRMERRRSDWRTGLLTHYMYLASAPFLAIAAYYLLVWTGIDSKLPIVVLFAFCVGIISDPVLKKITDVGYGFLRHKQAPLESKEISESADISQLERKPPAAAAVQGR